MEDPVILHPPAPRRAYRWAGLALMAANKVRRKFRDYDSPRPFPASQIARSVEYELSVVDKWLALLEAYRGTPAQLSGQTILELGPGPDLGTGLLLLEHGAERYIGLDKFPLARKASDDFYHELFNRLTVHGATLEEIEVLRGELKRALADKPNRLHFVCNADFSLPTVARGSVDLVLSQAAFEHFEALDPIFAEMTRVARPGATLLAVVDLKTHTRWIRDRDPLNIYRYSDFVYGRLKFPGSPNRLRPRDYELAVRRHGWQRVEIAPLTVLERAYVAQIAPELDPRFQDPRNQLEMQSIALCATRK